MVPLYLRYRYDTLKPWLVLGFESEVSDSYHRVINLDIPKDYRSYISHGDDFDSKPYMNFPVEFFEGKNRGARYELAYFRLCILRK